MSDAVLVAIISTVGLVAVALMNRHSTTGLGRRLDGLGHTTERVREQVENSHRTNFRDDHDELRREVRSGFEAQTRRQDEFAAATGRTHRRIEAKVDGVVKRLNDHIDGTTD